MVHILKYIRDIKTLGLKYFDDINDAPVSYLWRQVSINNDNQLMYLSYYSWQTFPDTGRSTGAYIIFYQGGTTDHGKHVPGPVAQSSEESEYNAACT